MKYQRKGKIKKEHHIMKGFEQILQELEDLEIVQRIIPGRISRQQKSTSQKVVSISYETDSGIKILLKKGATVQETFVICNKQETKELLKATKNIIKNLDLEFK